MPRSWRYFGPKSELSHVGWVVNNNIPSPAAALGAPALPELVDVIRYLNL